ncbi:SigB/SigF/SigG family RNA polymerase sigma factor [Streptomyces sp. LP05-1]|uniref:SigB/SigF/SigG family RNA polymerase sigma factor n=1 Tax=Streptomyces pyxinae TaxID=2970734 RepID=A0ABT2CLZ9_9ACTN|nr:SigB/SigF/SigG family RNA polymerase sigma factor [Streptomyces sp. LP05-1]MCS0638437.1 SigB/SigF/SigG family RNA polymerase sigma factor [Streptomyces sp. LP05-1]
MEPSWAWSARGTAAHPAVGTALPRIEDAAGIAPRDARELSKLFLDRLRSLEEGTREHQYARNTLIEMNLSLVRVVANRFRNRGDGAMEDIVQVGTIGLIKAIDRFDLSREVEFTSFAIPYISGEIKRYFRDTSWAVHVPRRLQELRGELLRAKDELSSKLGRTATPQELADHLGMAEKEITEGLVAANGYTAGSLDTPTTDENTSSPGPGSPFRAHAETVGERDPAMDLFEDLHTLAPLLARLEERERHILDLRFVQEKTQAQIGAELGYSQMHISRLLTRILRKLRAGMRAD